METKVCIKCNKELPMDSFRIVNKKTGNARGACKACEYKTDHTSRERGRKYYKTHVDKMQAKNKRQRLKRDYNLTPDQYDIIMSEATRCSICNRQFGINLRKVLDHNHTTGAIREVLCDNCNFTLGHAFDSIEILEDMITYLKKHK